MSAPAAVDGWRLTDVVHAYAGVVGSRAYFPLWLGQLASSLPRWRLPRRPRTAAVQPRNKPSAARRLPRMSVAATGPSPQPLDVAAASSERWARPWGRR